MRTLNSRCCHAVAVFAFLFIVFTLTTGRVVHTSSPQIFRSRLKGQVVCYACLSYTYGSDSQRPHRLHTDSKINFTDLSQTLSKGGLKIPKYAINCAETHPANVPNYHGIDLVFCPNTDTKNGACVKLKGRYKGAAYVYRNCWNNMWTDERPYTRQMSERCYVDELVQKFVATNDNKICFCEDDLCNVSHRTVLFSFCFVNLFIVFFYL